MELKSKLGWDSYYLQLAKMVAKRSKDPSTKVGAVIVANSTYSLGYNGLPRGVKEHKSRWQRPEKYTWVIHAELNAILSADLNSVRLDPHSKIYVTHRPCSECTKAIIQCGIKEIITAGELTKSKTDKDIVIVNQMLREAKVRMRVHYEDEKC